MHRITMSRSVFKFNLFFCTSKSFHHYFQANSLLLLSFNATTWNFRGNLNSLQMKCGYFYIAKTNVNTSESENVLWVKLSRFFKSSVVLMRLCLSKLFLGSMWCKILARSNRHVSFFSFFLQSNANEKQNDTYLPKFCPSRLKQKVFI